MELAVNLFNKGLQMDTNPMVLGNDTLSDALNATFVTMNGNEVILQNDMGNRRIDHAFLPSGYLPVGMKEYGGVIYVAAYNPLTNRGLIGSFPSPQRRVNINNEGGELDLNRFIDVIEVDNKLEYIIKNEYIIIPISDKMVLHTGDKFSIYSDRILEILPYLTTPSITNNLFTFLIGTFNSQNEFVDISNKLMLWDLQLNGKTILYYINSESGIPNETIADSELIKARNRIAINTYSLKMSSPLYLKAIINHINNVSCFIYGTKGRDSLILEIKIIYTYDRCIDKLTETINGEQKDEYFQINFNNTPLCGKTVEERILTEQGNYLRTIIYETEITDYATKYPDNIFYYTIKFPLLHNYEWKNRIYIESLTKKGLLDISKLDSDTIELKGYRYFNDMSTKTTTLEIDIESYPKKESSLSFTTYINNGKKCNIIEKTNDVGTGTITQIFSWDDFNAQGQSQSNKVILQERELYTFKYLAPSFGTYPNSPEEMGMFITTEIFNGNYIGKISIENWENYYIKDDNNEYTTDIKYSYDDLKDVFIKNFADIKKIQLYPKLKYSISNNVGTSTTKTSGSYIYPMSTINLNGNYKLIESWNIENVIDVSATINNLEIYPRGVGDIITIGEGYNSPMILDNLTIEENDSIIILEERIKRKLGDSKVPKIDNSSYKYSENLGSNDVIEIKDVIDNNGSTSFNSKQLKFISLISVNNSINGALQEKTIHCEHLIIPFYMFMLKFYYTGENNKYISIRAPYIQIDNEGDHVFTIKKANTSTEVTTDLGNENDTTYNSVILNGKVSSDGRYISEVAMDHISNYLNSECNGNFLVGEINPNDAVYGEGSELCYKRINNSEGFKRIWMKINKKDYIPIFTASGYGHNPGQEIMFQNDDLKDIFYEIPHCYEYEQGGKNLQEKIIGNNYTRTKEFEIDSNLILTIKSKVKFDDSINDSFNNIFMLGNYDNTNGIVDLIEFKEGIIHSNESFEEDVQNIQNSGVYCAILEKFPISSYTTEQDSFLHIRDKDGNFFDPLYIYYNDNECKTSSTYYEPRMLFKKSYVADKFYVLEIDSYIPELKNSKELYHGKKGNDNRINEYISSRIPSFTTLQSEEYKDWRDPSIIRPGETLETVLNRNTILPLKTPNIFNRTTIRDNHLYSTSPFDQDGKWVDCD